MKIDHGDEFESLGAEFQYQWIVLLKATLKKHAIADTVAEEICGEFSFGFSMLIDQGEIDVEGASYRPIIGFTADEETIFVQPEEFDFHDYAFGNTSQAFGR